MKTIRTLSLLAATALALTLTVLTPAAQAGPEPPTVTTLPATGVSFTNATANGTVIPNGLATTWWFQYDTITNYDVDSFTTPPSSLPGSFVTNTVSLPIFSGLQRSTKYYYRLVATNSAGIAYGTNVSFTTLSDPPTVTTVAAANITATTAVLTGSFNPFGGAGAAYFQYGFTTNYGSFSATNSFPATSPIINFLSISNLISGLAPATPYHFRLVGMNSGGTNYGVDLTFITSNSQPVAFSLAASSQLIGGAFQLSFTNLAMLPFTVLGSTNVALPLTNWTVLGPAVENPPGTYQFTDPQATNNQQRYYRVTSP